MARYWISLFGAIGAIFYGLLPSSAIAAPAALTWGIDKALTPASVCLYYNSTSCFSIGTMSAGGVFLPAISGLILNPTTQKCDAAATHGFAGDGVADNVAAFDAWFTGLAGASGCLEFTAGTFKFNSAMSKTLAQTQHITIEGVGSATELWSSGAHAFLTLTYPAPAVGTSDDTAGVAHVRNVRITTDQTNGQVGLKIIGSTTIGLGWPNQTIIENVAFGGHANVNYWANDLHLLNVYYAKLSNITINGSCGPSSSCTDVGIKIEGADATHQSIAINADRLDINTKGTGVLGTGIIQGINIQNSVFLANTIAFDCSQASGLAPQCSISSSHMNSVTQNVRLNNTSQSTISDNLMYLGSYSGMPANSPMILVKDATEIKIHDNIMVGLNTAGTFPNGIDLQNADIVDVSNNQSINNNAFLVIDSASDEVHGDGNSGNTVHLITNAGTNSTIGYTRQNQAKTLTSSAGAVFNLQHGAGTFSNLINGYRGTSQRWQLSLGNAVAETGGNAGSDGGICRYDDAGVVIDCPWTMSRATGLMSFTAGLKVVGPSSATNLLGSTTAPTISSGFGTSPSVSVNNGTWAFRINVGTGGTATSGVIGLPAATTGWNCTADDITTTSATAFLTKQTASSTTTATLGNFNTAGAAAAWTASDILAVQCSAL